jgi:hypothetical protein
MNEFRRDVEQTSKAAQDYLKAEVDLLRIQLTEKASEILATIMARNVFVVAILLPVFFGYMALGFYLSELLDSMALGFLSVAGISALLLLLIYLLRKPLVIGPIQDGIIKRLGKTLLNDED